MSEIEIEQQLVKDYLFKYFDCTIGGNEILFDGWRTSPGMQAIKFTFCNDLYLCFLNTSNINFVLKVEKGNKALGYRHNITFEDFKEDLPEELKEYIIIQDQKELLQQIPEVKTLNNKERFKL